MIGHNKIKKKKKLYNVHTCMICTITQLHEQWPYCKCSMIFVYF